MLCRVSSAILFMVGRVCSTARVGYARKRSSRRFMSSVICSSSGLAGTRRAVIFSIRGMKGERTSTVERRKNVFSIAMENMFTFSCMISKRKTLFSP